MRAHASHHLPLGHPADTAHRSDVGYAELVVEVTDGTSAANLEFHRNVGLYYELVEANVERIVKGLTAELEDLPLTAAGVTPGWLRSERMLAKLRFSCRLDLLVHSGRGAERIAVLGDHALIATHHSNRRAPALGQSCKPFLESDGGRESA